MRRTHDALVEDRDVHEELVEVDVLLVVHADEVVKGVAGDGEDGDLIALGVVEAVEQVDAAGAGGGDADADAAGVLGVADGGEGGGFFVADLDEAELVFVGAEGFEEAVDAVAGETEDGVDAPLEEAFYDQVGDLLCHGGGSPLRIEAA